MKKRTVFSVLLIFLFTLSILAAGLTITELGVREVTGSPQPPGALLLRLSEPGGWVLVFAGREWTLPQWLPHW